MAIFHSLKETLLNLYKVIKKLNQITQLDVILFRHSNIDRIILDLSNMNSASQ